MEFIAEELENYCVDHSLKIPAYLNELERATYLRTLAPQMIAGKLMGRFLSFISRMIRPNCIIEIGTFTGYSALCLAEGLSHNGHIHTFEVNDELKPTIEEFKKKSPYSDQIRVHFGQAEDLLPTMNIKADLAFLDAGKAHYLEHYSILINKMNTGGIILVDNVLWRGKVVSGTTDADTEGLRAFNNKIAHDDRCIPLMLPLRDGLTLLQVQ